METILFHGIFSFMASLGFGIMMQLRGKNLWVAAFGGTVGWLIYVGSKGIGVDDIASYFVASVVISLYAQRMAFYRRAPALVFLTIAFIPLVPGYAAYQTMIGLLMNDMETFVQAALYTFKVVMAIATGFLISTNVKKPVHWMRAKSEKK